MKSVLFFELGVFTFNIHECSEIYRFFLSGNFSHKKAKHIFVNINNNNRIIII